MPLHQQAPSRLGDGVFGAGNSVSTGSDPIAVDAADFDGDGNLDLAFGNFAGDSLDVIFGNGDGTFGKKKIYYAGDPHSVTLADHDGDGDIDIATANNNLDNVGILFNNGDATFTAVVFTSACDAPVNIEAADADGDGDSDLLVGSRTGDDSVLLVNDGSGTFSAGYRGYAGELPQLRRCRFQRLGCRYNNERRRRHIRCCVAIRCR